MNIIQQIEKEQAEELEAKRAIPEFSPGDTLRVNVKVIEGERTRVQAYEGVCIARSGGGIHESFTVRKISYGEGVERVFPVYSPLIDSIEVIRKARCAAPSFIICVVVVVNLRASRKRLISTALPKPKKEKKKGKGASRASPAQKARPMISRKLTASTKRWSQISTSSASSNMNRSPPGPMTISAKSMTSLSLKGSIEREDWTGQASN